MTSVNNSLSTVDSSKIDLEPDGQTFDILAVNLNLTSLGAGNSLGLAHYTDGANASGEGLETGYVTNGKFYPVSEAHANSKKVYLYQQVNAVVTIDSTKLTAAATASGLSTSEILGQLYEKTSGAGLTFSVTFSTPTNAVEDDQATAGTDETVINRARVFDTTALSGDPVSNTVQRTNNNIQTLIQRTENAGVYSYAIKDATNITVSAKVYVWGGTAANSGSDVDANAVTGMKVVATVA